MVDVLPAHGAWYEMIQVEPETFMTPGRGGGGGHNTRTLVVMMMMVKKMAKPSACPLRSSLRSPDLL